MRNGFSFIEVLVSLALLSFILLGFDAMQIYALRENQNAYNFSVAANQLHSMGEHIRARPSPTNVALSLAVWNKQNQALLPLGAGQVTGVFPHYRISLFWGTPSPPKICRAGNMNCVTEEIIL